ncbi:hypothetical protein Aph02nite_40560 [Actinoplanes philippinensis]|uniref:Uncharacterized protein n=2 Tax=Actinoplanes philippinensis TaxID=35752 RepID=A0A1I2GV63_9ACTN|nr:hypothetical protein [Actinoplanes philippinensis]GIE78106.1 hypothetical protein Aph02nite_40560 [Actinoplanes philippinensis]SFF21043.1 hypothetical protein SAMN05421541_107187 [Actinoplanes philippinensis]
MHECADGIALWDPKSSWLGEIFLAVGAAFMAAVFWSAANVANSLFGPLGLTIVLVVEAAILIHQVRRVVRAYRLDDPPRVAGILCPHGVQLTDPASEGRMLAWPEIAGLEIVRAGPRTVAVVRLARWDDRTGLPQASRLAPHPAVPDDPGWLWLGFVPWFKAGRVRAAVASWRAKV